MTWQRSDDSVHKDPLFIVFLLLLFDICQNLLVGWATHTQSTVCPPPQYRVWQQITFLT